MFVTDLLSLAYSIALHKQLYKITVTKESKMIRIVCPHCHAPLSIAELEQVTCNGQLSLVCPECSVVLVSEQQADRETHSLDEHYANAPMAHA